MLKVHSWLRNLKYALIAATMYCIAALFFIRKEAFTGSWILYSGNFLFALVIAIFILRFNKKRAENASTTVMIFAGIITTVIGIITSCLICLLLLLILVPGVFSSSASILQNTPPQMTQPSHELILALFMSSTIGNFCAGAFIALLLPFSVKRDQTGETQNEKPG